MCFHHCLVILHAQLLSISARKIFLLPILLTLSFWLNWQPSVVKKLHKVSDYYLPSAYLFKTIHKLLEGIEGCFFCKTIIPKFCGATCFVFCPSYSTQDKYKNLLQQSLFYSTLIWLKPCVGIFKVIRQVASFWISDRTANYQISKNNAYPNKHVRLHKIFRNKKYLPLEKSYTDG